MSSVFASKRNLIRIYHTLNHHPNGSDVAAVSKFIASANRTHATLTRRLIKSPNQLLSRRDKIRVDLQQRTIASMIARTAVRQIFRIRTWLLTGTVAGGAAAANKYEEWRSKLPKFGLSDEQIEGLDMLKDSLDRMKLGAIDVKNESKQRIQDLFDDTGARWQLKKQQWLERRQKLQDDREKMIQDATLLAQSTSDDATSSSSESQVERNERLQQELIEIQSKYQREIETLEKEVKELKKQLLLRIEKSDKGKRRHIKKSLIDMYSEVLDELSGYDSSYSVQDNLPRVVVVGDQSSGKTSVLEMIAQARIFPRGAGEMMTRAPVKVTLSEGPYHTAQFKDSTREFDLTKESDLEALRKEIELRMRNSVLKGKTVSNDVIALTVKGANMPRMVLVDLPGVISTVTTDMAVETRDDIQNMCKAYMMNPNAIILCIQDGSVDAERSNVTDLVSSMDPKGRRTIMVLTKVDMAEQNLAEPMRIKRILEGKLFPMKALGYFAVVTGKGSAKDSIESIKKYEEQFFSNSKLFKNAKLKTTQMTTRNMSMAVSECFWRMVKESVEQQADAFRATRFNLETEWKNNFPRVRELNRDELFDKARSEILDEIINLEQLTAESWELKLKENLIDRMSASIFENIYIPSYHVQSAGAFNTSVDIKLRGWVDKDLPAASVKVGWDLVRETFARELQDMENAVKKDRDAVLMPLKCAVLDNAVQQHQWDGKATDYLRVLQMGALEEREIHDKREWDAACKFMSDMVSKRLKLAREKVQAMRGPTTYERWVYFKSPTEENMLRSNVEQECTKLYNKEERKRSGSLSPEDITVIRRNLESDGIAPPSDELIRDTWHHFYRMKFLERAEAAASDCRSYYYHYQRGFDQDEGALECAAVPMFHRISRLASATSVALRQQITNTEQRRLEKEIKETLDEWASDEQMKKQLLQGRRVQLAEELKQVRAIQEKLEEFVHALNSGAKP